MFGRKSLIAMTLVFSAVPGLLAAQEGGSLSVSDFLPPSAPAVQSHGINSLANGFQIGTTASLYEHLRLAQWRQATASELSSRIAESDRRWESRYGIVRDGPCLDCETRPAAAAAPE